MKVFVTGATGFIGSHLVRRLTAGGHQVRCLVRKTSALHGLADLPVELFYGDVNDRETLRIGMRGCEWLFHLANLYAMWEPDPARFRRTNVDGTRAVLECALEAQVKKVVYVSTVAVFGKPESYPFDETSRPGPVLFSEYARTKAAAEQIAWEYHHQGLPLVVLYPGIVLGAGDEKASGHYIQDIIRRRVPSTIFHHSPATYVYIEDVVDAMIHAAVQPETVGEKFLIGSYTLDGQSYASLISRVSGVPLPILRLPDAVVTAVAYLLTGLSTITHRAPLWGLSIDAARTLKNGFQIDGRKAERQLHIHYTPIQKALEEAIDFYREQWGQRDHSQPGVENNQTISISGSSGSMKGIS